MQELSLNEVDNVSGAVPMIVVGVFAGGIGGGLGYLASTDNPTVGGAVAATASGALGGAIGAYGKMATIAGSLVGAAGNWLSSTYDKATVK